MVITYLFLHGVMSPGITEISIIAGDIIPKKIYQKKDGIIMSKITKKQAVAATATAVNKSDDVTTTTTTATTAEKAREGLELLIREQNRLAKKAKIDTLVNGDVNLSEFIKDPYYNRKYIGSDGIAVITRPARLRIMEAERAAKKLKKSVFNNYRAPDVCALFLKNCAKNIAGDLSIDEKAPAAIYVNAERAKNAGYKLALEKFDKCSIGALEIQLNQCVKAIMGDAAPKMLKTDVRAILKALTACKVNTLEFNIRTEAAFMDIILEAIHHRSEGSTYTITSKAKILSEKKKII